MPRQCRHAGPYSWPCRRRRDHARVHVWGKQSIHLPHRSRALRARNRKSRNRNSRCRRRRRLVWTRRCRHRRGRRQRSSRTWLLWEWSRRGNRTYLNSRRLTVRRPPIRARRNTRTGTCNLRSIQVRHNSPPPMVRRPGIPQRRSTPLPTPRTSARHKRCSMGATGRRLRHVLRAGHGGGHWGGDSRGGG